MPSIRHTGIVVTDIEKSIDFYRQYFGFEVQKDMIESGEYIDNFCSLEGVKVRTVKMALENGDMIELLDFISHPEENNEKRINNIGCTHFALTIENLEIRLYTFLAVFQLLSLIFKYSIKNLKSSKKVYWGIKGVCCFFICSAFKKTFKRMSL